MSLPPPRIDIGEYPDGRFVQLLDLGVGRVAEIPIARSSMPETTPHTLWRRQGDHWVFAGREPEVADTSQTESPEAQS